MKARDTKGSKIQRNRETDNVVLWRRWKQHKERRKRDLTDWGKCEKRGKRLGKIWKEREKIGEKLLTATIIVILLLLHVLVVFCEDQAVNGFVLFHRDGHSHRQKEREMFLWLSFAIRIWNEGLGSSCDGLVVSVLASTPTIWVRLWSILLCKCCLK